jgi:F-type H+-transporting ATPase subunit b
MSRLKRHSLPAVLFALLLALAAFLPARAGAQENSRPAGSPASAQAPSPVTGEVKGKGEEEPDPVRHSSAVRRIANKTGLTVDQAYWLCVGINFGAVFIFIAVMLRKKLPGYFAGRTAAIQKGIEEARKMSEEARRRLGDVESRLSRLDSDIAAMRREAEENAKAEEARIQAAGEEERRRIVTSAEQEISMAARAARRELKSYAAGLAVDLAEKKIQVGQETDEALVHKFTVDLRKDGE